MTRQEIFDKVWFGIIEQGGPSFDDRIAGCKYRGPNGRKCAAGFLIPDELYNDQMEGKGAYELSEMYKSLGLFEHIDFITTLQDIHDLSAENSDKKFMKIWRRMMIYLADSNDIVVKNAAS